MSRENYGWLSSNVKVGFTTRRGHAWWWRAESSPAGQTNHYPGPIPVQDVLDDLFHWRPLVSTVTHEVPNLNDPDGEPLRIVDPHRHAIIRSDTEEVFGYSVHAVIHDYKQWLIDHCTLLMNQDLQLATAGQLKGGARAWCQYELPDTVETPEGVDFRPFLLAATGLDGSIASSYSTGATLVVCDNTLDAALASPVRKIKIKHTKNSTGEVRIEEIRNALDLVSQVQADMEAQIKALCETTVSQSQWEGFLQAHEPMSPDDSALKRSRVQNRQDHLRDLYQNDPRCAPWQHTAFGVIQTVNTWRTHHSTLKSSNGLVGKALRVERVHEALVSGETFRQDKTTFATLSQILSSAE
jgi:phage/plasmid-like protein (TIGR03299 family)